MSIHAHNKERLINKLYSLIGLIEPLNAIINATGWTSLDNDERKDYSELSHKIRKLNKKINRITNDYYGVTHD